jgi:DNA-binding HxlR family transcriptional regulator
MKGKKTDWSAINCAIARSLSAIGDQWSILIIRDALAGARRFGEFEKRLGLAKNILAARLKKLVDEGVMETRPTAGGGYREYVLTAKGEALFPVLVALWQWGEKFAFAEGERTLAMVDRAKHEPIPPLEVKAHDGRAIGPRDYTSVRIGGA